MLTGTQNDEELLQRALCGDEVALADLFERHRGRLRQMVLLRLDARVQGRVDASDVLQDAFIELARRLPDYAKDRKVPFYLWLRMVTGDRLAHLHRAHLGAAMRNAHREVSIYQTQMPGVSTHFLASRLAGQVTSVDRRAIQAEVQLQLQNVLNSMDESDREILALRHFEELTTDEISHLLGLTRSGVLKRYTRALRRLRESLQEKSGLQL